MFADIIVDISIEALDKTFSYHIPEGMLEKIQIGSSVVVPFGRGNKELKGFVLDITENSRFDESKVKDILRVDEKAVSVESELLQIAGFIRKTYGSTMNEALKTVLPIKSKVKSVETHWLSFAVNKSTEFRKIEEKIAEYEKKHWTKKAMLLRILMQQENKISTTELATRYKITKSTIDSVAKEGLILMEDSEKQPSVLKEDAFSEADFLSGDIILNEEQQACVDCFCSDYDKKIVRTYLLHGVTGSGKTEVYIQMMKHVLESGKQGIILIPEISLTHQTVARFYKHFGKKVAILNSRLSEGEKFSQYEKAKRGEVSLVIGPRSALFMPFSNIGLIIMDEEHENSYKSESTPKYHAREVAIFRAKLNGASTVLGSATPSVDSFLKASEGEYTLLSMQNRAGQASLPKVEVVDLREEMKAKNRSIFSRSLQKEMEERLKKKEQTMLFLNRRGYSGFVSCRSCGSVIKCSHCDISLTQHKNPYSKEDDLVCHYCGETKKMPDKCPSCGSPFIAGFGLGTQKVEQMVKEMFPQARVARMDADTTKGKEGHERVLSAFRKGDVDILIGTQMIVKGHDFPRVTLVGVLAADLSMFVGDYRSAERTFQLLMQASGRAGRGKNQGKVVIQTYDPEHYTIQAVEKQDYSFFYQNEIAYRRMLHYPPMGEIIAVLCCSKKEEYASTLASQMVEIIEKKDCKDITVLGPTKASISRINDWYRYIFYIKGSDEEMLAALREELEEHFNQSPMKNQSFTSFDKNPMIGY